MTPALPIASAPRLPLRSLDTLWVQVTGTLCNLACRHCFISCGPKEDAVPMMSADAVRAAIDEGAELGARDIYFTGGEPFLHPELVELCEYALRQAPLSVLTNGLFFDDATCARLAALFARAEYSFDLRVSLDGMDAAENDPLRGRGTFAAIEAGLSRLAAHGLTPVVTVVEHREGLAAAGAREAFLSYVRGLGFARPRVKFLPLLHMGREAQRTRGYRDCERVHELSDADRETLQCATSRMVTADGVWPCPILVREPAARLGKTLRDAAPQATLFHPACHTCQAEGLQCRT